MIDDGGGNHGIDSTRTHSSPCPAANPQPAWASRAGSSCGPCDPGLQYPLFSSERPIIFVDTGHCNFQRRSGKLDVLF
jgi:hypothetical protein